MKYYLFLILIIFFQQRTFGQIVRTSYCKCDTKGNKLLVNKNEDSVYVEIKYNKNQLNVDLFNNTKDTIFLFNSYFEKDISLSKYIYRYNKKEKKVKISFLPLIPFLYTKYSDKFIVEDRIIKEYQTVYNFYKIPPFYHYTFNIDIVDLKNKKKYIKEIKIEDLNKFEKIKKFKKATLCKNSKVDYFVEFAYYKNISLLCKKNAYFLEELEFNSQAKNYKIIKVPLYIK